MTAHSTDRLTCWHLWVGIIFTRTDKEVDAKWHEVPCQGHMGSEQNWNGEVQLLWRQRLTLRAAPTGPWASLYWNFCFRKFLLGEVINAILVQIQLSSRQQDLVTLAAVVIFVLTGRNQHFPLGRAQWHVCWGQGPGPKMQPHWHTCDSWFRVSHQGLLGGVASMGTWSADGVPHKPLPPVLACRRPPGESLGSGPPLAVLPREPRSIACSHAEDENVVSFFAPVWLLECRTVHSSWSRDCDHQSTVTLFAGIYTKRVFQAMNGALPSPSSLRLFKYRIWTSVLSRWNPDPQKKEDLMLFPLPPRYKVGDRQRVKQGNGSLLPFLLPLWKAFWC